MINKLKNTIYQLLRRSEKWTKTDMVYLSKGGFWLTLGQVISSLSAFMLALTFANFIPQEVYGAYKYIMSIIAILTIPTLTGMHLSVARDVARGFDASIFPAFKTKLKWGSISTAIGFIVAVYYFLNGNFALASSFLIAGIFIPTMNALLIYEALLSGKKLFKLSSIFSIYSQIAYTTILVTTLYLTNNIIIIILAYFSIITLTRLFFYKLSLKKIKINEKQSSSTVSYGKQMSGILILGTIAGNIDKMLLWHFLGAVPLAVYAMAQAPIAQISALLKQVNSLAYPKLASANNQELKQTLVPKLLKFFLLVILIVSAYVMLCPFFYKIFLPQYTESIRYSQYLAIALIFFPQKMLGLTMQAKAQKKAQIIVSTSSSTLRIILYLILLPLWGINGAIIAHLLPYALNTFTLSYFFKKL